MAWLLDSFKKISKDALDSVGDKTLDASQKIVGYLRDNGLKLSISEEIINAAIDKSTLPGDIKSLSVSVKNNSIVTNFVLDKGSFKAISVAVNFMIEKFSIGNVEQIIVLKQVGKLETEANGWIGKIGLWTSEAIISGLLNKSLLHFGLKDQAGVCVENDLITIDLKALGLGSLLEETLLQKATEKLRDYSVADYKVGQWAAPLLSKALLSSLKSVGDVLAITGAACEERKLVFNVGLVKAS